MFTARRSTTNTNRATRTGLRQQAFRRLSARRGRGFFRTLYFLPVVTSTVAASIVWTWIFQPRYGLLMIPFQAILIPEYLLLRQLGWLNTFAALIIPGAFSAFAMFLLRQAFLQIPVELEESAMIDGANPLQVLRFIVLPLSRAALVAFAVITVQAAWNDFLFPLVVANEPQTRVVTIRIALLQGERSTPWNLLMMGSFLATVPMLILFVILQRYFIEGVSMTGVKG